MATAAPIPVARKSRDKFTVADVCDDLQIAQSTFYEWRTKGTGPLTSCEALLGVLHRPFHESRAFVRAGYDLPGVTRPVSYATTTAWARSRRLSLARMRPTWVLVVCSAMTSVPLISVLDRPRAISRSTSVSRRVSAPSVGGDGGSGRGRRAKSAINRRVTDGASSASPVATTRTAWTSSAAGASLSRKPLAPARSASYTYSSRSNVVS